MNYPALILELQRVHRQYSNKDLPHSEAIRVLKSLYDMYGVTLINPAKTRLKNHI